MLVFLIVEDDDEGPFLDLLSKLVNKDGWSVVGFSKRKEGPFDDHYYTALLQREKLKPRTITISKVEVS